MTGEGLTGDPQPFSHFSILAGRVRHKGEQISRSPDGVPDVVCCHPGLTRARECIIVNWYTSTSGAVTVFGIVERTVTPVSHFAMCSFALRVIVTELSHDSFE